MPAPEGYVTVAERIQAFYEKFPEGVLRRESMDFRTLKVGDTERTFVIYKALAYREPGDKLPAQGTAWEPFPGPTPFTRDSEVQNAETAAWGRAIAALGIETHKGVATAEEVERNVSPVEDAPRIEKERVAAIGARIVKAKPELGQLRMMFGAVGALAPEKRTKAAVAEALKALTPAQADELEKELPDAGA
jgi:hypothetical protein